MYASKRVLMRTAATDDWSTVLFAFRAAGNVGGNGRKTSSTSPALMFGAPVSELARAQLLVAGDPLADRLVRLERPLELLDDDLLVLELLVVLEEALHLVEH